MITRVVRAFFNFLGADLRKVSECTHRHSGGGQAFALLRPSKTHHVYLCTECGLVEREVYGSQVQTNAPESRHHLN